MRGEGKILRLLVATGRPIPRRGHPPFPMGASANLAAKLVSAETVQSALIRFSPSNGPYTEVSGWFPVVDAVVDAASAVT